MISSDKKRNVTREKEVWIERSLDRNVLFIVSEKLSVMLLLSSDRSDFTSEDLQSISRQLLTSNL